MDNTYFAFNRRGILPISWASISSLTFLSKYVCKSKMTKSRSDNMRRRRQDNRFSSAWCMHSNPGTYNKTCITECPNTPYLRKVFEPSKVRLLKMCFCSKKLRFEHFLETVKWKWLFWRNFSLIYFRTFINLSCGFKIDWTIFAAVYIWKRLAICWSNSHPIYYHTFHDCKSLSSVSRIWI